MRVERTHSFSLIAWTSARPSNRSPASEADFEEGQIRGCSFQLKAGQGRGNSSLVSSAMKIERMFDQRAWGGAIGEDCRS